VTTTGTALAPAKSVASQLAGFHSTHIAIVDLARARAYAAATNDAAPAYASGSAVPPLFVVVTTWPALIAGPAELLTADMVLSAVQTAYDVRYHRPLVPGEAITTEATFHGLRGGPLGSLLTIRLDSRDQLGCAVVQQFVTVFIRAITGAVKLGLDLPPHAFPYKPAAEVAVRATFRIDPDQPDRYATASGDHHEIHLDPAAATRAGFDGVIVHGLCTMAMSGAELVVAIADGDPRRVRRLAGRFSKAAYPGAEVTVAAHEVATTERSTTYRFEAVSGSRKVIADGCLELARKENHV
jgi:acyl dehydratase